MQHTVKLTLQRETFWLLVLLSFGLLFVTRPSIHGNDGVQNYAYLRSLFFDGDLDFTNEYTFYFSRSAEWFDQKQIPHDPVTRRPINLYGVGNALLWAPWVLAFHGIGICLRSVGWELNLDGYSPLYERAVGYASATYASVGLLLVYLLLKKWVSRRSAFWTTLIIWLTTPLFFYMYLHPSMSHANSFFLSSLVCYLYWTQRDSYQKWASMGIAAGLLVLTRFQDGILLLPLAVVEARRGLRLLHRRFPTRYYQAMLLHTGVRWLLFGLCFCAMVSLQLYAWKYLHGSAFSGPRGYLSQGQVHLLDPRHFFQALFSPFHGLFHWHPLLLLSIAGFLLRSIPLPPRLYAALGFGAQAWVVGSWSIWWAGASFGQRMFISTFPHLALGLAAFVKQLERRAAWLIIVILIAGTAWNFGLAVQYATRLIPRQAPVSITTLARNNLIVMPRLLIYGLPNNQKSPNEEQK